MSMRIEVCYGLPEGQSFLATIDLPDGATDAQKVGVYGKISPLDAVLANHDRVEIYRPLKVDPKMARQRRVEKTRRAGSIEGRKWQNKDSR